METKKANGQMNSYMIRDHYDLLLFALRLSGRIIEVLLQFESIIFYNLINSMIHLK